VNVSLAASRNIVTSLAILSFAKKDLFYQASVYLFVCLRILTPIKVLICNGVGTNFGVGVGRRGEALRAENGGWGSWGEDSQPLPPTIVCGSAVSSLSGVHGGATTAEGFSCILSF